MSSAILPPREPDQRGTLDPERVEDADGVVLPRPGHGRPGRLSVETEVGADRPEPLGEIGNDRLPQPGVAEPAVQKEHDLATSRLVVPEAASIDVDYAHVATI